MSLVLLVLELEVGHHAGNFMQKLAMFYEHWVIELIL